MTKIVVGKSTFRDIVMDYNPIFRVIENMGNGTFKCISEDEHYGGVERYFSRAQLLEKIRWEEAMEAAHASQDDFWAQLPVGETIHYDNGFGEFVRGIVVERDGEKKLKPIALVGNWSERDLPKRRPNGEVYFPHHADKIVNRGEGAEWQPHESCVYEANAYSKRDRVPDPRTLTPIDLSVPDMTFEEQEQAELERAIDRVREILDNRYRTSEDPNTVLKKIVAVATFQA